MMVDLVRGVAGHEEVEPLVDCLEYLARSTAGDDPDRRILLRAEGKHAQEISGTAEEHHRDAFGRHRLGQLARPSDQRTFVVAERPTVLQTEPRGHHGVVAERLVRVQRQVRRVKRDVVGQEGLEPSVVHAGDALRTAPEESMVDEEHVGAPADRSRNGLGGGVHRDGDFANRLVAALDLDTVPRRIGAGVIVDLQELSQILVQRVKLHALTIRAFSVSCTARARVTAASVYARTVHDGILYRMAHPPSSVPASEKPARATVLKNKSKELSPEEVAFSISADEIRELDDGSEHFDIIGQPRALRALRLAIDIEGKGYNIFATGLAGTGKRTAIQKVLKGFRPRKLRLQDIVYVHNFKNPDRPRVLYFKPGEAQEFRKAVVELIDRFRQTVNALFADQEYKDQRDRIVMQAEGRETQAVTEFEQKLNQEGFEIVQVDDDDDQRTDIAPIYQGESASFDELQRLVTRGEIEETAWNEIREKYYSLMDEMKEIFQNLRTERINVEENLRALQIDLVKPQIEAEVARIRVDYPDARVHHYLDDLLEDALQNLQWFRTPDENADEIEPAPLWRYGVNIVVDNAETQGVPVIFESHPDHQKLFGTQETIGDPSGERTSTFMQLRAGSLLQAAGGFLVLRAEDILAEEDAWISLKRALQDGTTEIRPLPNPMNPGPSLKPEPVEVPVKVIIMGSEHIYDYLYNLDEEFQKLFKVPAEFDSVMVRTEQSMREYIGFMRMICRDEGLRRLDHSGMGAVAEYGVRLSEFRNRLSTQFSRIADLIRESDYWAARDHHKTIGREDVERALRERKYLYDLPEEKIDEQIVSGELLISVSDRAIGRINGLAVLDRGYYAFARPMLITARVAPGDNGIINIERESGLSGEIHDKGIYILQGFLESTYATDFPLNVNASVAFEQSYVEVDGDSASSTEIYVILSAIANLPLRQEVAVTGSVNQMGQIQPVGGISEKIEGFYEVCGKLGFTGTQGVIIPRKNMPNLILNPETQQAVAEGRFHIFAIETIDEGLEILTGMSAGIRGEDGHYPAGSVNALVEERLRQMANVVKDFGNG